MKTLLAICFVVAGVREVVPAHLDGFVRDFAQHGPITAVVKAARRSRRSESDALARDCSTVYAIATSGAGGGW